MIPARLLRVRRDVVLWGAALMALLLALGISLGLRARHMSVAAATPSPTVWFVPRSNYSEGVFLRAGIDLAAAPLGSSKTSTGWVTKDIVKRKVPIPRTTQRVNDPRLDKGQSRVVSNGSDGLREQMVLIERNQSGVASETIMKEWVSVKPEPTVIAQGTREPLRVLMTSRGSYTYRKVLTMVSTAYEPSPRSCGRYADGFTAIGMKAQPGVVAVDPRIIPLRTRLYVEGYGPAIAADVGGAIKGNRIDVFFNTVEEALRYGRRRVKVYILEDR